MQKEVGLDKTLYKILLYILKVIPMVMAFSALLNIVLSYYGYEYRILCYLAGTSILTLVFFYIASYVFRFCIYHRMFIHYVSIIWVLNIYDLHIGILVDNLLMLQMYLIITGVILFTILYLYVKNNRKVAKKYSR